VPDVHRPQRPRPRDGAGQSFLIVDGDTGAIIDPGGNVGYNQFYLGMSRHFMPQN